MGSGLYIEDAYVLQPAMPLLVIQPVPHHELVRYRETEVIGPGRRHPPLGGFVQKGAKLQACGPAWGEIIGQGPVCESCIEYILNDKNVFGAYVGGENRREVDLALTRVLLVARRGNKIEFDRQFQIPDQVGQKNDRTLEHAQQERILVLVIAGDVSGQFPDAIRNLLSRDENYWILTPHNPP